MLLCNHLGDSAPLFYAALIEEWPKFHNPKKDYCLFL